MANRSQTTSMSGKHGPGDNASKARDEMEKCALRLKGALGGLRKKIDALRADVIVRDAANSAVWDAERTLSRIEGDSLWYESRKNAERIFAVVDLTLATSQAKMKQALKELWGRADKLLALIGEHDKRLDQVKHVLARIDNESGPAGIPDDKVQGLRVLAAQSPEMAEKVLNLAERQARVAGEAGEILADALSCRIDTAMRWSEYVAVSEQGEKERLLSVIEDIKARAEGCDGGVHVRRALLEQTHLEMDACVGQISSMAQAHVMKDVVAASRDMMRAHLERIEIAVARGLVASSMEVDVMKDGLEILHNRKIVSRLLATAQKHRFSKGWVVYAERVLLGKIRQKEKKQTKKKTVQPGAPGGGVAEENPSSKDRNAVYPRVARQTVQADSSPSAPAENPLPSQTLYDSVAGMEFVWVPEGEFQMGSDEGDGNEQPVHTVFVDGFWIGKTPVTQRQWKAMMGNNPAKFRSWGEEYPVEKVSWDDAQQYLMELTTLSGVRYRLPTEAEWEYAARGGIQQQWAGTDNEAELAAYAWYSANSEGSTHSVTEKQVNPFGLCHMSGNVWEWCADLYDEGYYRNSPRENPAGPVVGATHVIRGGSWYNVPRLVRTACRRDGHSQRRFGNLGFRIVMVKDHQQVEGTI